MSNLGVIALLAAIVGGGPSDLLDYVKTASYWKEKSVTVSVETMHAELATVEAKDASDLIKQLGSDDFATREAAVKKLEAMGQTVVPQLEKAAKSDDPEVVTRAKGLIDTLKASAQATAVRRLMAIRTLGELRKKESLATLKPLLESKAMFEAEYAAAAIAIIEGKATTRPAVSAEDRKADLAVMPAGCALLGQVAYMGQADKSGGEIGSQMFDKVLDSFVRWGEQDKDKVARDAFVGLLKVVEQAGNMRVQVVTVGMSGEMGMQNGWVAILVRGRFDRKAIGDWFAHEAGHNTPVERRTVDGAEILSTSREAALVLLSDERVAIVACPGGGAPPIDELVAAVKAGKNKDEAVKANAELVKGVDMTKPLWAAASKFWFLGPLDHLTLEGDVKDGALTLKLAGEGKDVEKLKEQTAKVSELVKMGITQAEAIQKRLPDRADLAQPAIDAMKSVKIEADGGKVTGSAQVKSVLDAAIAFLPRASRARPAANAQPHQP